ncbi:hypothetical protein [Streptomyces griseiscabiei]|uniref:Uncharacterized protein n=2 Tax=Streptomyces griseiscabiei TaxID=2993540 RepID=A0ABU4L734_9ACTN|nr:hypothetical protein [Streptomyces griseiscabiei]MBZ3901932.1 hypothetical protein [Streptomyces griseiscabiei]MDX2910868.1 hypothetical protein [Streptomyces griseiscabiei]
MPTTAEQLLSALEPLPFPARLALTARTARGLAEEGTLAPLLTELDGREPYERRLAAFAALVGRDAGFLAERLADPDPVVAGYAWRAARDLPVPDRAVEAAYDDAPAALRGRLARLLAAGDRAALAERLVARLRAEWGDAEAARLLPACSTPFVARELPGLAHAVDHWTRLASRHPDPVLDHAERTLADRAGGQPREEWWWLHATTVAALARLRPERVTTLLERHGPGSLPPALNAGLGPLVTADADRVIRWITSADRNEQRHEPLPPTGVLRRLVRAEPASLTALGRHWLNRGAHFAALVKAMAPGRRPAFVDTVAEGGTHWSPALSVLELLPRERRWAEVRRAAAEFDGTGSWWDDLDTLAHGSLDEARAELLAAIARPDADDRAIAWPLFVACAARDGGRAAITELLTTAGRRLRNDRDPVRVAALGALAGTHPRLFAADHAPLLDALATDALEARDASAATTVVLRTLAVRLLVEHATGGEAALREWALRTLERLTNRVGVPDLGPLHRELRRGQEHQVVEALRPWLDAGAGRADFRLLLGLAAALGPRARRLPELQDRLATALERGDDDTFREAVALWLDAPATRDERAAAVVDLEPSAVVLTPVRRVLTRRRTDLLDTLLGETPPYGRFLVDGARRPLPDLRDSDRWLPRQQRSAIRLAARAVADRSLPLDERAALIRAAAPVPVFGRTLAFAHQDDPEVLVAEAALGALPWTDRPHAALPALLEHAGGDRARVAVYAAARAARFTAPSELALALGPLLSGERPTKVTARKEAVRLAARFLPPRRAVALLVGTFDAPDRHPDVRAAVVRALPPLLDEPEARRLLAGAAHDDSQAVHEALLAVTPWEVAEAHRRDYAAVIVTAYDITLALTDCFGGGYALLRAMGTWCRYSPALAVRIARTACDLGNRKDWRHAEWVVRDLAASGLPHPVGGAAPGSVFHGAVAGLLAAMRTAEGGADALEGRDLPALQRLRHLTSLGYVDGVGSELLEAVAAQLAPEPLLAAERAQLLGQLVDRTVEPGALLGRLRELAEALESVGTQAAVHASGRLRSASEYRAHPGRAEALLAAADGFARDGGTATGLLAVGLVNATGVALGWPEEWRSLLRLLRRHTSADVRHAAYLTLTENE